MREDHARDLAILALQEQTLQFDRFDADTAWELGSQLRAAAQSQGAAALIEVRLARETVFLCAMPGTAPDNADWARRKHNTVELVHKSSYAFGRELKQHGIGIAQWSGLPDRDYTAAGGCFPIRVKGVGCVGNVTVSGLPERDDHRLVVGVLAKMLGLSLEGLELP